MNIKLPRGRYVLAVSGGVDSMVLLDLLSNLPGVELVVAHFNHGIRHDSHKDEVLVRSVSEGYRLPMEAARGYLGPDASEAAARAARYRFLEKIRRKYKASLILTAHHQDDLIETALLNVVRGTGRRGLVALAANPKVIRPLLGYTKADILKYADEHQLKWQEDSSNLDDSYLRNYLRHHIMAKLTEAQRRQIISNIDKVAIIEDTINPLIAKLSQKIVNNYLIDRQSFTKLPISLGNELILYWLRQQQVKQPDRRTVDRLNVALRAAKADTLHPVSAGLELLVGRRSAQFSDTL